MISSSTENYKSGVNILLIFMNVSTFRPTRGIPVEPAVDA